MSILDNRFNPTTLSLYGGVRSRYDIGPSGTAGLKLYQLAEVETHTIDGKIQIPDPYPHTGSINFFYCQNVPQDSSISRVADDNNWYEEHYSVITRTSQWYHDHIKATYQASSTFPQIVTGWHIPEMFYGRQLAPKSIVIAVNSFVSSSLYLSNGTMYWVDDGLGRLWSVISPTVPWNSGTQVPAVVLYNEGLIVFTHQSASWHAELKASAQSTTSTNLALQFNAVNYMKSMVFLCRLGQNEANASNNPTYYITDETGKRWAHDWKETNEATTYITAIGIYNDDRELVAVAKLAQPIRKRERDSIDIRLKLDI